MRNFTNKQVVEAKRSFKPTVSAWQIVEQIPEEYYIIFRDALGALYNDMEDVPGKYKGVNDRGYRKTDIQQLEKAFEEAQSKYWETTHKK